MIKSALQSSLINDIKYRSMSVGNVPSSEFLIQTIEVGATPLASVTFDNLAQFAGVYRHLQIVMAVRGNRATFAQDAIRVGLNGDTTLSNYGHHGLQGNGSSVISFFEANQNYFIAADGSQSATNAFGAAVVDVLDAYSTSKFKTLRALSGHSSPDAGSATGKRVQLSSLLWRNTNALTSITISTLDSTLAIGSRFSLYGVV